VTPIVTERCCLVVPAELVADSARLNWTRVADLLMSVDQRFGW
jgi:hypothetical protein